MKSLNDKVAVITGAGSGIGRALAIACAAEGMRLALLDLKLETLQQTAELIDGNTECLLQVCDVTQGEAVEQAANAVYDRFGATHLLFNNAGVFTGGPMWQTPTAEWRRQFDVNVMGVVHGLRSFVPRMIEGGVEGHIVNTASVGGLTSPPHYSAYSATKHAVVALTECLHHDLNEVTDRIGASVLCPAFVKTAIADDTATPVSAAAAAHFAETRALMERARLSADDVARITLDGVKGAQFYIITHPGSLVGVEWRMRDILDQTLPTNPMSGPARPARNA